MIGPRGKIALTELYDEGHISSEIIRVLNLLLTAEIPELELSKKKLIHYLDHHSICDKDIYLVTESLKETADSFGYDDSEDH